MSKFSLNYSLIAGGAERNKQDTTIVVPKRGTPYRLVYFVRALTVVCLISIASTTSSTGSGGILWSIFEQLTDLVADITAEMVWSGDFEYSDIELVVDYVFPRAGFTLTSDQIKKLKKRYVDSLREQVKAINNRKPSHLRKSEEELERLIDQAVEDFESALDRFKQD